MKNINQTKRKLFIGILVIVSLQCFGQTNDVIGSSGTTRVFHELSSTVGQVFVQQTTGQHFLISEGFQQSWTKTKKLERPSDLEKFSLEVYPNPSVNLLNIQSDLLMQQWKVYASNGEIVLENKDVQSSFDQLDITNLTSGIYYIFIVHANGTEYQTKFIKL